MADVLTPVVTEESEEKPQEKVNKKKNKMPIIKKLQNLSIK